MTSLTGDFVHAIQEMSKFLNVRGKVLPAANQSVILHAEMEDGTIVSGESKIPFSGKKIKRVFLTPQDIKPLSQTLMEIKQADLIVIGPGSLYTSILPNLLVPEIGEAVTQSKAKKVYICNLMTQAGETLDYTASDHVKAIYEHIGSSCIDSILVNNKEIPLEILNRYQAEYAKPVVYDVDSLKKLGLEIIQGRIFSYEDGALRHDTKKVASLLYTMIEKR